VEARGDGGNAHPSPPDVCPIPLKYARLGRANLI
jgi:hypothetical protein